MADENTPIAPVKTQAEIAKEAYESLEAAHDYCHAVSERSGPVYRDNNATPLVWHDQVLERELAPAGTLDCARPFRCGNTGNGLDLMLVASHSNTGNVSAAAGAAVTIKTLQGDAPDGPFEAVGPSLCVTAPADGISAEPDALFCRVALGNFTRPWLKINLSFAGSISGGKLDAAVSYMAR